VEKSQNSMANNLMSNDKSEKKKFNLKEMSRKKKQ
jgi:hypothetical protein